MPTRLPILLPTALAVALLAAPAISDAQGVPGLDKNTCLAAKNKCVSQYAAGLLRCRALCQKNPKKCGTAQDLCEAKVLSKLDDTENPEKGCFAKAESKQDPIKAASLCTTTGDAALLGAETTALAADLVARLEGVPTPRCGDGEINAPGEHCDGTDLGRGSCEAYGLGFGTLSCTPACTLDFDACGPLPKRVFVTSQAYDGNLGGVTAADDLCQAHAASAGLPGSYLAWISSFFLAGPETRFHRSSGPYVLPDGTRIATGWKDLTDGRLEHAIDRDEFGRPISYPPFEVWTNTLDDGSPASLEAADSCYFWRASTAYRASVGSSLSLFAWTDAGATADCRSARRLYCFQQ